MRLIMAQSKEERAAKDKAYREANKERISAKGKAWYKANKESKIASSKAWNKDNHEKALENTRAWKALHKEEVKTHSNNWGKVNPDKVNAKTARRRALKLKLIPKHLKNCRVEKQRVLDIHKLCLLISRATGIQHHVDHMWPLSDKGPEWSGNMQIITAYENLSKGASVDLELKHNIQQSLKETM